MFARFAQFLIRRRRSVLVATLVFFIVAVGFGGTVTQELIAGGTNSADAESSRAAAALEAKFGAGAPNYLVVVTATGGDVTAPAVADGAAAVLEAIRADPGVLQATSYWERGDPALRSADGDRGLIVASVGMDCHGCRA